jgi:hypothetical protein
VRPLLDLLLGLAVGVGASSLFVLALFVGFCVLFGFVKLRSAKAGRGVVRNLDEALTHQPVSYLSKTAPRGPADQLHTPELREAAARQIS